MRHRLCFVFAVIASFVTANVPHDTVAQPAPSFRVACVDLRAAIATLDPSREGLITIEIEDALRGVHFDGALAYLLICAPPHPQVLCVTYSTGDRKPGDRVVVTGNFNPRGPEHVLLDPCLHSDP